MCTRIIAQLAGTALSSPCTAHLCLLASVTIHCSAGTALQAATPRDCIEQPVHRVLHPSIHSFFVFLRQCPSSVLQGLPCRQLHHGTALGSPCTVFCIHPSIHLHTGTALMQPVHHSFLVLLASVPIQCSARTALQAATHGDCIGAARAPFCVHCAHFKGEA